MHQYAVNDFGTKIRFKCHQQFKRKEQTLDGEFCSNWNLIDGFGVRLDFDDTIFHIDGYKNFYEDPNGDGWDLVWPGKRLRYIVYFGNNRPLGSNGWTLNKA